MSELQASHMTMFTVIAEVVAGAFGDKKSKSNGMPRKQDITEDLTQLEPSQYVSRVTQLLSGG